MSNLYRGPSIDASYQVSVHMAEGFQRRSLKCEKLTDDGRQVMAKAHMPLARWANKKLFWYLIHVAAVRNSIRVDMVEDTIGNY